MAWEEEKPLVESLQRGDHRAFRKLVVLYQHRVFTYLYRMLGNRNEAEEVCQEVFIAAYRFMGGFRGECSLLTWLFKIATNMYKNKIRYNVNRKKGKQAGFDELVEKPDYRPIGERLPNPEQMVATRQLEVALQECINKLPEEFREVLVLRDMDLLSYEEIQDLLGIPEGTIKSRLHRARGHLARMLGDHLENGEL